MSLCSKHSLENSLFCANPECMTAFCLKCLKEHAAHTTFYKEDLISDLKAFNLEKKLSMEEAYKKLSEKNKLFLNMANNFDETTQKNEYLIKQLAIEFLKHIEETLKALKEENKNKRSCFEKILSDNQELLQQLEKKINDHSAKMKETQENIEQVNYKEVFYKYKEIDKNTIDIYEKMIAVDAKLKIAEIDPKLFLLEEMGKFISFEAFSKEKLDNFNEKIDECKKKYEKEMKKAEEIQLLLAKMEEELNGKKEKLKKLDDEFDKHNGMLLQGITQEISKISDTCKDNSIAFQKMNFLSRKFNYNFIDLSFNTQFGRIDFENNGKICKNRDDHASICFTNQILSSNIGNILRWKMAILNKGICHHTGFGIVERNENVLKLQQFTKDNDKLIDYFKDIKQLEALFFQRNTNLFNLQGKSFKFSAGETFHFKLDFTRKIFTIKNKQKTINLAGKITKNEYYFAVSPCCEGWSYYLEPRKISLYYT